MLLLHASCMTMHMHVQNMGYMTPGACSCIKPNRVMNNADTVGISVASKHQARGLGLANYITNIT